MKLENQKTLVKLYQNNYTQTFEDLKKDFEKAKNKALLTETSNKLTKETLEKTSFSFPKNKKPKYGFRQFDRTNYVTKSCMKEFYEKYSQILLKSFSYPDYITNFEHKKNVPFL